MNTIPADNERSASGEAVVASESGHGVRRVAIWLVVCMLAGGALIGVVLGSLALAYGSVDVALAHLRGEPFILVPSHIDLGDVQFGDRQECRLQIVNLTDQPLEVLGMRSGCGCTVLQDALPLRVPPNESHEIHVSIAVQSKRRDLNVPIAVYSGMLDDHAKGNITARVSGVPDAVEPEAETAGLQ